MAEKSSRVYNIGDTWTYHSVKCSCGSTVEVENSTVGARTVCDKCGTVYDEDLKIVMKLPPKITTGLHDLTYSEIQAKLWEGIESVSLPIGLGDRFTDDALVELGNHPCYQDFPQHFKSWLWSALDRQFHRSSKCNKEAA